jgi:Class III cytochrome C family.
MRRLSGVLAALVVCVLLPAGLSIAYEVPNEIVIKRPAKNKPLSDWVGPVTFPHGMHAVKNACRSCHHKESDKDLGQFVSCTQCHSGDSPEEKTGFYLAWHNDSPNSCLGCHRKVRLRETDEMPPLSCTNGCHKKK